MIVKFIASQKESWQDFLDACIYAYNTSLHESTHFTPFQLMFGRQAILPIDINSSASITHNALDEVAMIDTKQHQTRMKSMLVKAKENIVQTQQKQKEAYDRKHASNPAVFSVGSVVLKKDFSRKKRKGGKLDAKWVGPFKICRALGKGLYSLTSLDRSVANIDRVNGKHLKPYKLAAELQTRGIVSVSTCMHISMHINYVCMIHYFLLHLVAAVI